MTIFKWTIPALMAAGLTISGAPTMLPAAAETPLQVAQTDAPVLAREADTMSDDLRVINRCIDDGGKKTECLCVTQILKYEMTLVDYRRAARLYAIPAKSEMSGRSAEYSRSETMRKPVVTRDVTAMVSAPNFEYRCNDARQYFKAAR